MKLCECGCGNPTPIAKRNYKDKGYIKGQPIRFCPNHHSIKPLTERFINNIEFIPECGCWIWMGHTMNTGYGILGIGNKYISASRLSWQLHYGEIPEGMYVCHHCDTPLCVNPHHLFIGTQKDNILDCIKKKRFTANERVRVKKNDIS